MNRSTGLLRAYATLIRRVSGAASVCLYLPPEAERTPVLIYDGEPVVGELSSLETAATFSRQRKATVQNEILKIQSDTEGGWLIGVQCGPSRIPLDMQTSDAFRRRAEDEPGRTDSSVVCWIGLRFGPEELGGLQESAAFRLLGGDEADNDAEQGLVSLLDLGGVLAWYARQISSILDDPVTGLAGRAEFQASLNHAFETARESGQSLSLLFINPDDFTAVNENNGHEAGDRVLREIGERLRKTHRVSDAIAKYGGAIFASFLPDTQMSSARIVAEKIWSRLSETKYLDGSVRLGISVGVAIFDPEKQDVEGSLELIRRADKALNAAKRFGGDHIVAWDPELEAKDLGSHDRMTGVYTGNMAKDYRNMTLLSDTMTAVAGSSNVGDLADQVVQRLFNTLKADRISILEWRDEAFEVLRSLTRTQDGAESAPLSEPFGWRESEKTLIEDARRGRRALHASFSDEASGMIVLCFAVPLLLNDTCIGCLYLDGRAETVALEGYSDLGFLRALATQLAVALDRARLGEQQQEQSEKEQSRLRAEVVDLRTSLQKAELVYKSSQMESLIDTVRRVAPTKATVLVIGESGTGKELVARTVHELSPFNKKPLVVVDCGAIPTTLIESELFGHERGAYTGAQERRIGRLLEAEGGTVILDEIGELPLEVQSKLLRFVQERQITPVGGTRVLRVDTRLVAVSNRELAVEAAAGRFREDLYYRLNVVRITVPPLRERPDDILFLAEHFLERFMGQYQKGALRFTPPARVLMQEHHWPGNVRELQNRVMQAVILAEGSEIGIHQLDLDTVLPEQTQEWDMAAFQQQPQSLHGHGLAVSEVAAGRGDEGLSKLTPVESWAALGSALTRQIQAALDDPSGQPVPLGTWLMEDIVLQAYGASGEVSGRARALLGVPETTFRRRLRKATSKAKAKLLMRKPPWKEVSPHIAGLLRTPDIARTDVLQTARDLLLSEVSARVDDPALGAALMGVTVRTYRRWMEEMPDETLDPQPYVSV